MGSLKPSSCRLAAWVVGWVGRVSLSGRRVEHGAVGRRVGVYLTVAVEVASDGPVSQSWLTYPEPTIGYWVSS